MDRQEVVDKFHHQINEIMAQYAQDIEAAERKKDQAMRELLNWFDKTYEVN